MKKSAHRYIVLITALAFIVNIMLPFYAIYSLPANDTKQLSSIFGDKVLICTSDGFKWFSWEDIQSGKEKPKTHEQIKCPVCYVAAHSTNHTFVAQNVEFLYSPEVELLKFRLSLNNNFISQISFSGKQSRAPPYYA
ncbi:MAG: hypothetical protein K0R98_486 [Rickettsiaceae bacterium]|jgi:hypothetical protein|nr:hypothetical protein [Rickettsiaceae bacterium]